MISKNLATRRHAKYHLTFNHRQVSQPSPLFLTIYFYVEYSALQKRSYEFQVKASHTFENDA